MKLLIGWIYIAAYTLRWMVLQPCFAAKYKAHIVDKRPIFLDGVSESEGFRTTMVQEFSSALSAMICQEDSSICLHACCCHAVRLADTYSSVGLGGFWMNFLLLTFLDFLLPFLMWEAKAGLAGALLCRAMFAAIFSYKRGSLRHRMGGEGCSFIDFLGLFCCPYCAACQEARHVDGVAQVHVACCFVLMRSSHSGEPLVGQPVFAGEGVQLINTEQGDGM
jgi:Cys-rich protein (TIGR01571 family)